MKASLGRQGPGPCTWSALLWCLHLSNSHVWSRDDALRPPGTHVPSGPDKAYLATLGPVLDNAAELQQALVQLHIVCQQLGVHNGQDVIHSDVHLHT